MSNFSVCSYNVGSRVDDYLQLCEYLKSPPSRKSRKEDDQFHAQYNTTQEKTAALLTNKAEVYCLQEVVDEERPLIKSLKENNFTIIRLESLKYFDTAIALDTKRFQDITNHSIEVQITQWFKKDVAIATATDILSGQRITFVSAHAPGFDFTKQVIDDEDAAEGDFYCQAILDRLSEIGNNTIHVIGADMNANPEKWNPRFQSFSNQGFQLHRKASATNVNPKDSVEQEREIDFIFTKATTSIWQKIKSIFVSTIQFKSTIKAEDSIGWDINNNASDHLPVFINLSPKVKISKIHQLWNATYRLLLSYFRTQQLQGT